MPDRRSLWATKAPVPYMWEALLRDLETLDPRNHAFVTRDQRISAHRSAVVTATYLRSKLRTLDLSQGLTEPEGAPGGTLRAIRGE